jgi:regulatory protein YycI of two-component signal transduction system YycFG
VKEISKCEEQIEHYIRKEIMLNDQIIDVTRENDDLKRTVDKISNEKGLISKQFESYKIIEKKKFTEKSVMVEALENALDNKKEENKRLKEELDKAFTISNKNELKCDQCNFSVEDHI